MPIRHLARSHSGTISKDFCLPCWDQDGQKKHSFIYDMILFVRYLIRYLLYIVDVPIGARCSQQHKSQCRPWIIRTPKFIAVRFSRRLSWIWAFSTHVKTCRYRTKPGQCWHNDSDKNQHSQSEPSSLRCFLRHVEPWRYTTTKTWDVPGYLIEKVKLSNLKPWQMSVNFLLVTLMMGIGPLSTTGSYRDEFFIGTAPLGWSKMWQFKVAAFWARPSSNHSWPIGKKVSGSLSG